MRLFGFVFCLFETFLTTVVNFIDLLIGNFKCLRFRKF